MATDVPSFVLRPARPADYAYAERLYLATMKPLLTALGAYREAELAGRLKRAFKVRNVRIITVDGRDVGWMQETTTGRLTAINQIHIEKPWRSQGIGTSLIIDSIQRARRRRRPVVLSLPRNNRAASLYRRLGFREVAVDGWKLRMRCDVLPRRD